MTTNPSWRPGFLPSALPCKLASRPSRIHHINSTKNRSHVWKGCSKDSGQEGLVSQEGKSTLSIVIGEMGFKVLTSSFLPPNPLHAHFRQSRTNNDTYTYTYTTRTIIRYVCDDIYRLRSRVPLPTSRAKSGLQPPSTFPRP